MHDFPPCATPLPPSLTPLPHATQVLTVCGHKGGAVHKHSGAKLLSCTPTKRALGVCVCGGGVHDAPGL